jgi:hypothetical protein
MATVAMQGDKVILKDGKVSCECCEECCMYPAEAYGTLYQFEDLPDEIEFKYTNFVEGGFFGPYTLPKFQEGLAVGYRGGPDDEVVVFNNAGVEWGASDGGGALGIGGLCLIFDFKFEGITTNEGFAEDLFADTYSISGPISGTVTRQDKFRTTVDEFLPITIKYNCGLWTGGELRLSFNSTKCKWTVNGNEKSGFQNTPVGSYAGGYTVS